MHTFRSIEELQASVGTQIGVSDWVRIEQDQIQLFADATGDHQWIHVDVERSKRDSPFNEPIAHGFLTLSLLPTLRNSVFRVEGVKASINYGLNRVRFITAVTAGSRIRAYFVLKSFESRPQNHYLSCTEATVEVEGSDRPACIAETLGMYVI